MDLVNKKSAENFCTKIRGNHYKTVSVSTGSLTGKETRPYDIGENNIFPTRYFVPNGKNVQMIHKVHKQSGIDHGNLLACALY